MTFQVVWSQVLWLVLRWVAPSFIFILIIAGLLSWFLQPATIPPADQIRSAASVAGFLLLMAAVVGIAAMATVQFWKVLFMPRAAFHAKQLRSFFGDSVGQVLGLAAPTHSGVPSEPPALQDLLDNPTELVMGQLRSAADYIILRPTGFENALRQLAGKAGERAIETYLEQRSNETPNEILVPVRFFVEQRLNLVHVILKERWRRRVRLVAVVVAGSTGLLTVILSDLGPEAKISALFAAAVWGGFFSWLARDVAALVERRRT